jgi:membrane fusion protein (multidrug efflux system)
MPRDERDNPSPAPPADQPAPRTPVPPRRRRRWIILGVVVAFLIFALCYWGIPYIHRYFTTASTDDAYVHAHVTLVAPRIEDNVSAVLVDDGFFVEAGTPLVRLDPYPFELIVSQQQAALDVAEAQLAQTRADIRAQEAKARAAWFQLQAAQEQIRAQLAALHSNQANLRLARANLTLARAEYQRYQRLVPRGAASQEALEQRSNTLRVAEAQVQVAEQAIQQTRANLGLNPNEKNPLETPRDLEETYSAVQVALSNALTALAGIGVKLPFYQLTPDKLHQWLVNRTPQHNLNDTLDRLVEQAPQMKLARDKVTQVRRDLEQAELDLSYTVIRADVAGTIDRRNVNPGDHVLKGQNLMAIRSFEHVWIDANFKETQLNDIVIGLPVDIAVDAYPGKVFKGRVAGFNPATGSASALLPPENATGNFVKVVQRLPVRIELTEPNPRDTPLFAGLSVQPTVYIKEQPTGPNAGQRIRSIWQPLQPETPKSGIRH